MSNYSSVSKFVQSADGTRIFANAVGDSSNLALVFVHGGLSDQSVWEDIFLDTEFASKFFLVSMFLYSTCPVADLHRSGTISGESGEPESLTPLRGIPPKNTQKTSPRSCRLLA